MMLSEENINKLHMNGIYRCEPVLEWLPSYKRNNPYWCKNWTFYVREYNGEYYMYDTYWSTGDDERVKLTDKNFDKFEYLFEKNEVRRVSYQQWVEYREEDRWVVGLDSGGAEHYVRKTADKVKEKVIERLQNDINYLEYNLEYKKKTLSRVISGEMDYNIC